MNTVLHQTHITMKNQKQQNTGRRSFLKTAGLGMGALSLSPTIFSMIPGNKKGPDDDPLALSYHLMHTGGLSGTGDPNPPFFEEPSKLIRNLNSGKQQTLVYYGTSLTGGHWSKQTTEVLKKYYGDLITVHNRAKGGSDSMWGIQNIEERVLSLKPDAVTIEFSMNDAINSRHISVDMARQNLLDMIDILKRSIPNIEIILLTMNPLGGDVAARPANHYYYRGSLPDYYQMVREVAASRKLRLIDINKVWISWIENNPESFDSLVPDGVHPQEAGCREVILPAVLKGLGL
jgi:acyl-CoA thioesterase I